MDESNKDKQEIEDFITTERLMSSLEKANKKLEKQALYRGWLRFFVGIAIGILSANQDDWLAIINMGGMYIVVEAFWLFIYVFRLKYYVDSFQSAYNFAIKMVWRQVFMSAVFIGVVAVITKIIAGIFI
ncbi:MAG: hypothetical protein ACP5DQ_12285 [Bacteroidales bacterium]